MKTSFRALWFMASLMELLSRNALHSSAEYRSDSVITARQPLNIPAPNNDGSRSSLHVFKEAALGLKKLSKGHRVIQTVTHEVTFIVKQKNTEELTRKLFDVSDPLSINYGNLMSQKEVNDFTSNPDSLAEVTAFLVAAGATIIPQRALGECVSASAPIGLWERFFDTEFYSFSAGSTDVADESNTSPASRMKLIRAERYSIPLDLDVHVDCVINTIQAPHWLDSKLGSTPVPLASARSSSRFEEETRLINGYLTPGLLSSFYKIDDSTGDPRVTQAAYQTEGESFSPQDVLNYQDILYIRPPMAANRTTASAVRTPEVCVLNSCINCVESIIDMSLMISLARIPTWHSYTDKSFAEYLQDLVNSPEAPPNVINFSYKKDERNVEISQLNLFDFNAQKLGLMGTTIVVASGDDGVNSRRARDAPWECSYSPGYPAGSPYVVSVGSTEGPIFGKPEIACQSDKGAGFTNGGGFSGHYPMPAWQASHVSSYFSKVLGTPEAPVPGYSSGRGYPDLSVMGTNVVFICGGRKKSWLVGGTSTSAPMVAAMISNVNVARVRAGGKTVGFINPLLYGNSDLFTNDITVGDNKCTSTTCCSQGFHATTGWDPVTGLGSLNVRKFKRYMLEIAGLKVPSDPPSTAPVPVPSPQPSTAKPIASPSSSPSATPSAASPTPRPSLSPILPPTSRPSSLPSSGPTGTPSALPSATPTSRPSSLPSSGPTVMPSAVPSATPTSRPSSLPSSGPTVTPSAVPSATPTSAPSSLPSSSPVSIPSSAPFREPTRKPRRTPTRPRA